jgi:hypothetical protein
MNLIYGLSPSQEEFDRAFQLYGGNESEFLCLSYAEVKRIDPQRDPMNCKECGADSLRNVHELAKTDCPKCHQGRFDEGSPVGIS